MNKKAFQEIILLLVSIALFPAHLHTGDLTNEFIEGFSSENGIGVLKQIDNATEHQLVIRFKDSSYPVVRPKKSTDDFKTENLAQKTGAIFGSIMLMGLVGIAAMKTNNQKSLSNMQERINKPGNAFSEKIDVEKARLDSNKDLASDKKEAQPKTIDSTVAARAAEEKKWSNFIGDQRGKENAALAAKLRDPKISAKQKKDLQDQHTAKEQDRLTADSMQQKMQRAQKMGGLSNTLLMDTQNTKYEWRNEKSNISQEINNWKGAFGKNTATERESDRAFYDALEKMTPSEQKAAKEIREKKKKKQKKEPIDTAKEKASFWKSAREQGGLNNEDGSAMSKGQMVKKVLWTNALGKGSAKEASKTRKEKLWGVTKVAAVGAAIGAVGAAVSLLSDAGDKAVTSLIPWEIPDGKFRCPIYKNPQLLGFGSSYIQNLEEGAILKIKRLMGVGAAWLQNPLPSPLNFTLKFKVRVMDQGGVHIFLRKGLNFETQEDNSLGFKTKIMLGVFDNTVTAIADNGEIVAQVKSDQYPAAAIPPGIFTPYWMSYSNGFIMVGFGQPGTNVILSWQDPDPDEGLDRIGLSCDKSEVEFCEMYFSPAIEPVFIPKEYFSNKSEQQFTDKTTWLSQKFREEGRGTIGFRKKGAAAATISIALAESNDAPQVQFTVGSKNEEPIIVRYKNLETGEVTEEQIGTISDPYDSNPNEYETYWISNLYGQFTVGHSQPNKLLEKKDAEQGRNLIACVTIPDLAAANTIGISAEEGKSISIKDVSIFPAVELEEYLPEGYVERRKFAGTLKLISPFSYQFRQSGQSIEVHDIISGETWYPAKTPQQSATDFFNAIITPAGDLNMNEVGTPKNIIKFGIGAAATAIQQTAGMLNTTATQIGNSGVDPITQIITAAASIGLTSAALGVNIGAANLSAQAKYGFRDQNAYVYTEKVKRDKTASVKVTDDIQKNRDQISALIDESEKNKLAFYARFNASKMAQANAKIVAMGGWARDEDARHTEQLKFFELFVTGYRRIMSLLKNPMIATQSIKKNIFEALFFINESVTAIYTKKEDLPQKQIMLDTVLSLFLDARQNPYLLNMRVNDDRLRAKKWAEWIQKLALKTLNQSPSTGFTLNPLFGEYLWLDDPLILPLGTNGSIFFEAKSLGDIFVGLIDDPQEVRNTETDLYEVVFGGNNNTKSFLRIKSLGRSVAEASARDNPLAKVTPMINEKFWVSINNGTISAGKGEWGENKLFEWTDPYPLQNAKYIGLSTWNNPVTFSSIRIGPAVENITPEIKKRLMRKSYTKEPTKEETAKQTLMQDSFAELKDNDTLTNDVLTQNDFQKNDALAYDMLMMPDLDELTFDVLQDDLNDHKGVSMVDNWKKEQAIKKAKENDKKRAQKITTKEKDSQTTAAEEKQENKQMAAGALGGLFQEWQQLVGKSDENKKGLIQRAKDQIARLKTHLKSKSAQKKATPFHIRKESGDPSTKKDDSRRGKELVIKELRTDRAAEFTRQQQTQKTRFLKKAQEK